MQNSFAFNPGIKEEIDRRYRSFVHDIVFLRACVMYPLGLFLYLIFNILDQILYPSYGYLFWKLRVASAIILLVLFVIVAWRQLKALTVHLFGFACVVMVACVSYMVYLTDGSASRYYEGLNLVYLALAFVNSFDLKKNAYYFGIMVTLYEIAMIASPHTFNLVNFIYANYFMFSTLIFVMLMSSFYSRQHYKGFLSEQEQAMLYVRADKLSKTDDLTKIDNRRSFTDMLKEKIRQAEASGGVFYLIIFDVDYFKQINDTYGHACGDEVLVAVTNLVKKNTRSNDLMGRYGGDEFMLCLDFADRVGLETRLLKILNSIRQLEVLQDGKKVTVSISIGAARFKPGCTIDQLIAAADAQLLSVKKSSRGKFSIAD